MNQERLDRLKDLLDSGKYIVDPENGQIWNHHKRRIYGAFVRGYKEVKLHHDGKPYSYYVHEVIAVAGGLDILDKTVNHIDGNKLNNTLGNLEAITQTANLEHYRKVLVKDRLLHQQISIDSKLIIDGREVSDDEMKAVLAYIRILRS